MPSEPVILDPTERPLRPLNQHELTHTFESLLGTSIDGLTDAIPNDSRSLVYDRVGAGQTMSALHVEGYLATVDVLFQEALVNDQILSRMMPACDLPALGPGVPARSSTTPGSSLGPPTPEYRVCYAGDDWNGSNRCPEVTDPMEVKLHLGGAYVTLNHSVVSDGNYRIELEAASTNNGGGSVSVDVDGVATGSIAIAQSDRNNRVYGRHSVDVALTAGDRNLQLWKASAGGIYIRSVTITGPIGSTPVPAATSAACADGFVQHFAPEAWRRPLSASEASEIRATFQAGIDDGFFFDGLRMALQHLLLSPEVLYHVEIGSPTSRPGFYRLSGDELASRLSYLAWEAPPDPALRQAAAQGELDRADGLRAQAERLFADPRARTTVQRFTSQWLELVQLATLTKDTAVFPEFTTTVRQAMERETTIFLDEMIWNEGAGVGDLLTDTRTWMPTDLAPIYGVSPDGSDGASPVALPPGRQGLLTQPSILTIFGRPYRHSPVLRGAFILDRLLCEELPKPPDDVDFSGPDRSTARTTRERISEHTQVAPCIGCHTQMDHIGFGFESFDGIGRFQSEENGQAVDASAGVPSLGIPLGQLDGAISVADALAESDVPADCFSRQWLRFGLGRQEGGTDTETLSQITAVLERDGIRAALIELVLTEAFGHRINEEEVAL